MTNKEIFEGNKLIAEFMQWRYSTSFAGLLPNHWVKDNGETATDYIDTSLKFHSSWDWLMPVVEKCIYMNVPVSSNDEGEKLSINIQRQLSYAKIEPTYISVVEFIKWYNQNNQSNGR